MAPDILRAAPGADPTVLLELARPCEVRLLHGRRQLVTRIALAPDERARFVAALAAAGVAIDPPG